MVRSAPQSAVAFNGFMWAKAQSLYEMKCIVSAGRFSVCRDRGSNATALHGRKPVIRCKTHGVNELVVRLRIVQL